MKRITLTFDNGPHQAGTLHILENLAVRSLKAVFFVVGERLRDPVLRSLAVRAKQEGHIIGNHTLTHTAPLGRRVEVHAPSQEIGNTQELLGDLASNRLFRPNGDKGQLGPHVLSHAAVDYLVANKFTAVTWNCVPRDWEAPADSWVQRAWHTMASQQWTVLVLHDHCLPAARFLGPFLDRLIDEKFEFSQEFPVDCVVVKNGVTTSVLSGLVS